MKSDPKMVDTFLDRLMLKPITEPKPPPQSEVPKRAPRAAPVVMRMDRWQIAGHVVILPDSSPDLIERVLGSRPAANPPSPQSDAA